MAILVCHKCDFVIEILGAPRNVACAWCDVPLEPAEDDDAQMVARGAEGAAAELGSV